jgi:hypothetical protein
MRFWLEDSLDKVIMTGVPDYASQVFVRVNSRQDLNRLQALNDDRLSPWPLPYGYFSPKTIHHYVKWIPKIVNHYQLREIALDVEFINPAYNSQFWKGLEHIVHRINQTTDVVVTIPPVYRHYRALRHLDVEKNIMVYISFFLKMGWAGRYVHDRLLQLAQKWLGKRGFTLSLGFFYKGQVTPLSQYLQYPSFDLLAELPKSVLQDSIIFSLDPVYNYTLDESQLEILHNLP